MRRSVFIGATLLALGCVHRSASEPMPTGDVRHITVAINRPPEQVYLFAARPENVPRWARGLATTIQNVNGEWIAQSPMGPVKVRFTPPNAFGVLDHDVTLASGASVHNPMRVLPREGGRSEVTFTLFRRPGITDAEFEADASAVQRDLVALRDVLERVAAPIGLSPIVPFRNVVEQHLAAIEARDMERLLPTITRGADLIMIAPNGFKWDTRQQYVDFHRQWFATADSGRLTTEIVHLVESPALGHALIKYRYTSRGTGGQTQAIDSWLALTFALEDGVWRLVFDQNTMIAPR